jgi:hypothetical protein
MAKKATVSSDIVRDMSTGLGELRTMSETRNELVVIPPDSDLARGFATAFASLSVVADDFPADDALSRSFSAM